jgi:mutator protein MutT
LGEIAAEVGVALAHVKPHGALYHRAAVDLAAAEAIVAEIAAFDRGLAVVGFPGSELLRAASRAGLVGIAEAFADRRYGADGRLVPRGRADALVDGEEAIGQALALAAGGARTICLHSDSPGAAELAAALRCALESEGFAVAPCAPPARVASLPELRVVGAALIERGRVFLTRRSARMSMSGKWEFPGGKVEPDESAAAALAREIAEELGVAIEIGERIGRGTAIHFESRSGAPEGPPSAQRIVLEVYAARRTGGEIRLTQHDEGRWVAAAELETLDWPAADLPILPALVRAMGAG